MDCNVVPMNGIGAPTLRLKDESVCPIQSKNSKNKRTICKIEKKIIGFLMENVSVYCFGFVFEKRYYYREDNIRGMSLKQIKFNLNA